MHRVRVTRRICVAAAAMTCSFGTAMADPALVSTDGSSALRNGAPAETFLYFTGFDLWGKGGSAYGGLLWSPGGLNNDGFTLKLLLAGGNYLYMSGTTDITGSNLLASIMPGWRIKRGDLEIKLFAGLDLQHHRLAPDDPASSLRGNHAGARANAEIWWEPIPAAMMLALTLSGSTIGSNFGARGAAGWRVMDRFWAGPEIEASGDEVYRQYRVGAHITSFKYRAFEWAIGAGYVEDNSNRSGYYGRFSLLTRR